MQGGSQGLSQVFDQHVEKKKNLCGTADSHWSETERQIYRIFLVLGQMTQLMVPFYKCGDSQSPLSLVFPTC